MNTFSRASTSAIFLSTRRAGLGLLGLGALALWLASPARAQATVDAKQRAAMVPTGTLRVAVYQGSPLSMLRTRPGIEATGLAYELGSAMGRELGVPVTMLEHGSLLDAAEAVRAGAADFATLPMTAERYLALEFAPPLLELEWGYLVLDASALQNANQVDRVGNKVAVVNDGRAHQALRIRFKNAKLVVLKSLAEARAALEQGHANVIASDKAILFEMSDALKGSRVLEGRWGAEKLGLAIPRGRDAAAAAYLNQFASRIRANGVLTAALSRSGLRGTGPISD